MDASKKGGSVTTAVYSVAKPAADELGLEIWDIKLVKEGPNLYLRIFIDKEDGVTLDDCEKMSHAIDEPLELLDPIENSYFLEVSSPGIERELSTNEHLKRFTGDFVKAKLIRPDESKRKEILGTLSEFDKNEIVITCISGEKVRLQRKNISHINLTLKEKLK